MCHSQTFRFHKSLLLWMHASQGNSFYSSSFILHSFTSESSWQTTTLQDCSLAILGEIWFFLSIQKFSFSEFQKGRLSLCDNFYILIPIKYKLLECEDIVFCFYSFDVYTIASDLLTNVPMFCIPTSLLWKAFIIVFCLQTLVSYTLGYIFFLVCPL